MAGMLCTTQRLVYPLHSAGWLPPLCQLLASLCLLPPHTRTNQHTHPTHPQRSDAPELSEEKRRKQEKPLDFLVQQAAVDPSTKWRRVYQLGRCAA